MTRPSVPACNSIIDSPGLVGPAVLSYRWSLDPAVLNTSETTVVGDGYFERRLAETTCWEGGVLQFRCTDTIYVRNGIGIGASRAAIASSP